MYKKIKSLTRINIFSENKSNRERFQDVLVISGIFTLSVILIIGLLPAKGGQDQGNQIFILALMAAPAIAAVYLIIVSFRRKLYSNTTRGFSSIKFKISVLLILLAILPSLPLIFLTNNIMNRVLSDLFVKKVSTAFETSLSISSEYLNQQYKNVVNDLEWIESANENGILNFQFLRDRNYIETFFGGKGYNVAIYKNTKNLDGHRFSVVSRTFNREISGELILLLDTVKFDKRKSVYRLYMNNCENIVGICYLPDDYVLCLFTPITTTYLDGVSLIEDAMAHYKKKEYMDPYYRSLIGVFLLFLSLIIIIIAIVSSIVLTRNITKPAFELVEASKRIAVGDYNFKLYRKNDDEISALYSSFNIMIEELKKKKHVEFQMQKLEAWRDVARKLVHEIKNPLTPIRLSAERIKLRYSEKHPDIDRIVISGTETIIEEVEVLNNLLASFTTYARLPEIKIDNIDINQVITDTILIFAGNENIKFEYIPDKQLVFIPGDKMLLRQVLVNLFANAIDAMNNSGKIIVETVKSVNKYNQKAIIRVTDFGCGISTDDIDKIFEPTFSTKAHGTGLGLAIVQKIIFEHHGNITFTSNVDKGTTFIVELPLTIEVR